MRLVRREKGDKLKSRLVLRDIAKSRCDPEETYAATPALSAFRLALTLASHGIVKAESQGAAGPVFEVLDISQAFAHAEMDKWILTEVPHDLDGMSFVPDGSEDEVVLASGDLLLVQRALYGYRSAPKLWQQLAVKILADLGSVQSKMEPMLFYNQKEESWIVLHVDDLLVVGPRVTVDRLRGQLSKVLNVCQVGWLQDVGDHTEYLGREINRVPGGFEIGVNQKLVKMVVEDLNLERCRYTPTPCVRYTDKQHEESPLLDESEVTPFRAALGKLMHLALDRWDLQFACKDIARGNCHPQQIHQWKLHRAVRYLWHHRLWKIRLIARPGPVQVEAFADSDWGGEVQTRRSTSGGAVSLWGCLLHTWSRIQACIALSSAEAEYYSIALAVMEGRRLQQLITEACIAIEGDPLPLLVHSDSRAARESCFKVGSSRMKHIDIKMLFVKELAQRGLIILKQIESQRNPVDALTKAVPQATLHRLARGIECWQMNLDQAEAEEWGRPQMQHTATTS